MASATDVVERGPDTGALRPMGTGVATVLVVLTSVLMGPLGTRTLGDLGAGVVMIEPAGGDRNRSMGPGPHPEFSGIALNLLRNKRSIALDLKSAAGRRAFLDLAATADVMVTNLRPSPIERLEKITVSS